MKASNANKVISVLLSVAMCPMMVPTAAFAADDGAASGASTAVEQAQPADQAEASGTGASSGNTLAAQSETAGEAAAGEAAAPAAEAAGEASGAATTAAPAAAGEASGEAADPAAETGEEGTEAAIAEVGGTSYPSLQAAIDAASRNATVKLLADTRENVTISTYGVTLDLNGHTLNGSTGERKPALTVTARVTVMDSSAAQTGTIMREDTAENSGVSSHYVIDIQGSGWLTFESGNVTNGSGNAAGKGASLVRVGDDSVAKYPGLNIKGGTFTQDNFIVIKVDRGDLFLNGGTLNSANSYAIEDWFRATVKGGTVNGAVAAWTYGGGSNSNLTISGGTVNGNVESVTYDGAEGKMAKVSITGGTVKGTLSASKYNSTEVNDPTKATIEVTGGTFSTDPSRYLTESATATKNADGTYGVEKAYLAQVGENSYYTMDEAFKAQTASGEAITLLRDYTTGSTFNSGTVARVVDLNDHTWTCTGTDANSAAFEINYSDASLTVKNGKIVSSQLIGLIPSASGGTITYDNSTLTFEGVEATTTATSGIETNGNNTNDTVVLKNSTLNVPNGFGIYFPSSGTLTIDNSKINAKTMGAQVCSGSLNVTAGSAIVVSGDPVKKLEGDGAIQDGAAISIVNRAGYKGLGQIAITGGTFTAKAGNAALKAYTWDSSAKQESAFDNSAKTVAVSGGTFSAAVASDLCAEGYAPVANADGTYSVAEVAPAAVAEVNGTSYPSLQAAIDAAQDGQTVTLLTDVADCGSIAISKNITLEGNGHTISGNSSISVNMPGNATADVTIHNVNFKDIANSNKLSAFYFSQVKGKLTITDCTFDSIEYEAIQITPMEGAEINISNNMFKAKADGTQVRHIHIEMAYGSGFDCEGQNIKLTVTDNQLHGTVSGDASMGIWWVGTDSTLKVDGNYMEHPETVSITLANSGVRYNRGDLIYPARSKADVDVDDLMPAAVVADKASGESKIHAYSSLAEAVAAAQDGQTVTLLADATEDVAISKNITLDLGGKTLTNTNAGKATLTIAKGATATVKNGNVIGGTGYYTIDNYGTATLEDVTATAGNTDSSMIRNDGTLTIESGSYSGGLNVVKSEEDSTLTINGGKFELSYATSQGYTGVIYTYGNATITGGEFICSAAYLKWAHPQCVATGMVEGHPSSTKITGGTFTNTFTDTVQNIFHGVGKATSDNFEVSGGTFNKEVSEGYCADGFIPTKNADGTYGVKEGYYVAQIGSTKYETLADAIRLAAKGKTIQLLNDTTENITIAATKQITLDLNGYTLDGGTGNTNATILNEGTLTITDTSAGKTGTIKRDDQGVAGETSYYVIHNLGAMVIDQANVVNNSGIKGSSLVCNGGETTTASLTINGGTFEQQNFIAFKNDSNGELTINGGTLTSKQSAVQNWNKAQILGGNLTGIIWTDSWTEAGTVGETVIGGNAQFTGTIYMDVTSSNPSTLKIEGGSLDVTKWTVTSAAAAADATIAISGGTFTAVVPENYCAAGYAPTANADGTYGVKLAEGAYLLQDYRSGDQASWTYPTQDGMAFAGWYKDAAFETPCTASDVEGAAYAKFVKITDLLQFRGGSLRMDVAQPSELTWLRFGYTMALPEGASFVENGWYFKKVTTSQPTDVRKLANNNVLNIDGTITANLVFTGVTTNYYSANFSEKAFVKYVTADGTTVEAVESDYQVRSVLDVADVILAHPMASKAEKDYATQIKAAV